MLLNQSKINLQRVLTSVITFLKMCNDTIKEKQFTTYIDIVKANHFISCIDIVKSKLLDKEKHLHHVSILLN